MAPSTDTTASLQVDHDSVAYLNRLLERLKEVPNVTFHLDPQPFHSSYGEYYIFGFLNEHDQGDRVSASNSTTSASSILSNSLSATNFRRSSSISDFNSSASSAHTPPSSESSQPSIVPIVACVSPRLLWIQRTFQMARAVHKSSSASARQHKHGFTYRAMYRLSPQVPGDRPLQVIINEQFGRNALRALMNFGPNWFFVHPEKHPRPYDPNVASDGQTKAGTINMIDFFDFAVGACESLEMLHNDNRVVHGELRGDAFHFNRQTNNVRLAGFGSGARAFENGLTSAGWKTLSREYGVEYKLQFIAPEQTGRLPAAPDSRTDIYSLGIIFWMLLTGDRPFHGETALEIMQNVLIRRIAPLSSKRVDVPDALSDVVNKMLQKNIEDRYFSVTGLKKDLLHIRRFLGEGDSAGLQQFVVGNFDVSTFFTLPNLQVGRDSERAAIMEVVNHVYALQQRAMPAPRPQMLSTVDSNSSVSSRSARGLNEENASDEASVNSRANSGSGTNATAIRLPVRPESHLYMSQDANGDEDLADIKSTSHSSTDRRMSTGTPASVPGSDQTKSLSLLGNLQEHQNTVLRSAQRFQRKGKCELITVSGIAGLGKSTLIQSVQNVIRKEKRGYFAAAKFDQARQAPFEPVLRVMSSLFRQIFSESDLNTEFHQNLRSFVRPVWGALSSMLKLPHWLLDSTQMRISAPGQDSPKHPSAASDGRQPSSPSVSSDKKHKRCGAYGNDTAAFLRTGAQSKSSRFAAIFLDVLRFFSMHKFILFCLDDVQFADQESLELLQTIVSTKINMVVILTYREMDQLSAKTRALLSNNYTSLTKIQLQPLSEDDVAEYVCATLHRSRETVIPLVALIMEKTLGNPFFLREMLQTCYDKGAIHFCAEEQKWIFNIEKVASEFNSEKGGSTINSNEYIVQKFSSLPSGTRHFLAWASLLGNSFSYTLVKELVKHQSLRGPRGALLEKKPSQRKKDLVRKSSDEVVRGLQGALSVYIIMPTEDDDIFQFCHDRYQQAALSLFDCGSLADMHFAIAQQMVSDYSRNEDSALQVYDFSTHISPAVHLIKEQVSNRSAYRDILYRSAEKAAESGGRTASLTYYLDSIKLLQNDHWDQTKPDVSYSETLTLYCKAAETQFFLGDIEASNKLLDEIFSNAKAAIDKAPAWILKSRIASRQGDPKLAFSQLAQCLSDLGVDIPETSWQECDDELRRIREDFKSVDRTELLQRPLSSCQKLMTLGCVLCEAIFASVWIHPLQFYQLALKQFRIYMQKGVTSQMGLAFVHLGTVAIGRFNDIEFGVQLGEIGRGFLEIHDTDLYTQGRAWALYTLLLGHFSHDLHSLMPLLERAQQAALNCGDRYGALFSVGWQASTKVFCGHSMVDVENFCLYAAEELSNWQDDVRSSLYLIAVRQYARAMQGKTWANNVSLVMSDEEHNTDSYVKYVLASITNAKKALVIYDLWHLQVLYLFNHYEAAIELGEAGTTHWEGFNSVRYMVIIKAYLCLSYLALVREHPTGPDSNSLLKKARNLHAQLLHWSSANEVNFLAFTTLISAELAEIEGRYDAALQAYETGLDHTEIHGLKIEHALTSELYGEYLMRMRANRPARNALKDAIAAWRSISAYGKATQVAAKHEWLLRGTTSLTSTDAGCQTETAKDSSPLGLKDMSDYGGDGAVMEDHNGAPKHSVPSESMLDIIDLKGILKSSEALSSTLDLEQLMAKMTKIILEGSGGDFCAIVCEDENKPDEWVIAGASDANGSVLETAGEELNSANAVVGVQVTLYSLRFRETIFMDNIYDDERFNAVPDSYRERNPGGRAIIVVPIITGKHDILGAVYVEGPPHSFTEKDRTILQLLTNSIGISMTNAKLFKRVEKVSASNAVMVESQKKALAQARSSEKKAIAAEKEAMRSVREKEEAAKAKSMFLANVSHELRTPLNGVIGMSELLKSSSLSSEQEGYADSIRVCADTLLTVINDILDFSKLEAGKMQMFSVPLNLSETISEVVRALSYSNQGKELETVTDLNVDKGLLVLGDPVRLHQILMNLLSNAYKFTSKGSVCVGLQVNGDSEKDIQVTCSVADTGIGISEEVKQKLFLPFSQADSSTARSFGGTGLGLSICKAIIENVMKGKIWLESELGKGTKVSFSLTFPKAPKDSKASVLHSPRHQDHDPMAIYSPKEELDQAASLRQIQDLSLVPRNEIRVCIAEDNPINQKIAISFVSKLGFKPEAFADGQQALNALTKASEENKPYHIVLMDVQMPVLDGYNATRAIRKHDDPVIREVLVIAMTASAIPGDREKCLDAGMNDYMAKPVRQQVLKEMLNDYIDKKPGRALHRSNRTRNGTASETKANE